MHNGIGVGRLLFFSFVAVFLIPVVTLGFYYVELEKRELAAEKALLIHEYRDIQRTLLSDHVGQTVNLIRDRMAEAVTAPDASRRSLGDLQAQMLWRTRQVRFGESGHMFVLSREGILLADPWMREEVGKNVLALADSSGRKFYVQLLNAALADSGGGYCEYFSTMPEKAGQRLKIAYARYFPEWGWIVCADVFSEDMDQPISAWEKSHRRALHDQWRMRGVVLLSALFVSLLVSFLLARLVRREFTAFSRAFETAALSHENLETSHLNLGEFIRLSDSINRVLGERDKAVEAIRASEEKLRFMTDNSADIIWRLDENFRFTFISASGEILRGYSRDELIGMSLFQILTPEGIEQVRREYARRLEMESRGLRTDPARYELQMKDRDGSLVWTEVSVNPFRDREGHMSGYHGMIHDITERKAAEEALRASEEKYRQLVENAQEIIVVVRAGMLVFANSKTTEILGYSLEELTTRPFSDFIHPSNREMIMARYAARMNGGEPERYALRALHKNGDIIWMEINAVLIQWEDEPALLVFLTDITERKKAEEALRASEGKYRSLIENMDNGFASHQMILDENGTPVNFIYTEINAAFERICGVRREEIIGRCESEISPDTGKAEFVWLDTYSRVALTGKPERIEEFSERIGKWFSVSVYSHTPGHFVTNFYDITDRKQAEAALRESEEKHRILLDESSDPIFSFASDGRYLYVNRAFALGVRKSVEEIIGNRIWDVFDREEADKRFVVLDKVFKTGEEITFEVRVPRPDGDRFYLTTVTPIKDIRGNVMTVICSSKEITERVRADEALLAEKERLAVTLRSIGDGVITTDCRGRVLLLNWVAEKLTGWTQAEAEGRGLEEVFHIVHEVTRDRCVNPVNRVLATGGIVGLANQTLLVARDGREIVIGDSGAPILDHQSRIIGVVLVFRDVTTQKRMEDELLRMEKLESVGVLAGGIAHDFNNILTGILGAISMARLYIGNDHAAHGMLQEAEHQSLRARDLTGQLLTFSKGGAPVRITASIVETVRETVNFTLRGSRVRAEFSLPENLWTVLVDLNQLSHVVNNLALNSVQAMPEGGRIEVEAHNTNLGEDSGLPLAPGRFILLSFRDYGVGISREHLSRIFDPYFTTKQMGSGLGLATSWSIIKRHDGHIRVESELGVGTVFHIYLPATGVASSGPQEEPERLFLGQGRVLVMDDDDGIRKTASMLLEALGYSATVVGEGAAAIEVYSSAREEGAPFDAVIMDLSVPGGMGGLEAMECLLALDPGARVIVSSGYSTDPIMSEYSSHGFAGVLVKPYCAEDISRALRKVMGASENGIQALFIERQNSEETR